jgi:hypothetical protein
MRGWLDDLSVRTRVMLVIGVVVITIAIITWL